MADRDETDALFRRYRREAVLLHRPWPPHAGPPTNSWFGGMPRLTPRDLARRDFSKVWGIADGR